MRGGWLVALLCVGPCALAQSVNLQLNNPPSNNVLDGIYVGSYSATNTQTGASVQMTCDDFRDESNYNAATYKVHTFSNLFGTLFGGTAGSTKLYSEAAWLTLGMLNQTGAEQGYYSYAIWAVFDRNDVASWLTNYGDSTACNYCFWEW